MANGESNVLPEFSPCDIPDNSWTHSKTLGEFLVRPKFCGVNRTNGFHLLVCKLCTTVRFAFERLQSLLLKSVPHVIRMGSLKQMVWVKTRRVVACVTDFFAVRNRPVFKSPNKSVNAPYFILEPYYPITARGCPTSPLPATIYDLSHGHNELKELAFWDVVFSSIRVLELWHPASVSRLVTTGN